MKYLPLALTSLLCACTVGPDYVSPEIDAPAEFVFQEVFDLLNEGKQVPPVDTNWWEGFADPLLTQLVEDAIENNQRIASAVARVKSARANVRLADAGDTLRTGAGADTNVSKQRDLDADETDSDSLLGGVLSFVLPIDIAGRNRREVEAALANLESSESGLRNIVLTTSTDVVSEYLRLRGNQRQLELLRESVALQEKTLSIVNSRYQSGLSPELDLRRAETSVQRLQADIPPLLESLISSRLVLANLTGQYPGAYETTLNDNTSIPGYQYQLVSTIPVDVLRQRPDIQQTEARMKQTVAEIGVAEADFYPVFDLFGQMQISTAGIIGGPGMDLLIASIGAMIDQVITDGGARDANLDVAKARAEEALADYNQALLDAAQSIETTLAGLKLSLIRQESLEQAVQSSARSFEQAERLYQLGLSSFLDVVDAQRVLASAEQQLATERTSYATQIATLFRVLGTNINDS
jgi:NodT family efflux transporter outer membrane factor (OMF) lipoprotein